MPTISMMSELMIAFGPVAAIFMTVIRRDSRLVILTIGGMFYWLVGALLTSIVWFIFAPFLSADSFNWFTILLSVVFHESIRIAFVLLVYLMQLKLSTDEFPNPILVGLSSGVGAAIASILISIVPLMFEMSTGPSTLWSRGCGSSTSLFSVSSFQLSLFSLLHIAWMITTFTSLCLHKWPLVLSVPVTHLLASLSSLFNHPSAHCVVTFSGISLSLLCSILILWIAIRSSSLVSRKDIRHQN